MPRPRPRSAAELLLEAEIALLGAEVDLAVELVTAGYGVPGHRPPTTVEVVAGVRFAELDRIVEQAAAQLAQIGDRVRGEVLDRLALDLGRADLLEGDPSAVARRLAALADPTASATLPGLVDDVLAPARAEAEAALLELHRAAGAEAIAEAGRQGADVTHRTPPAPDKRVRQLLTDRAADVTLNPYRRALEVAHAAARQAPPTASPFDVFAQALDAAEGASTKGTEDLARRAASVAHDEGRTATLAQLAEPQEAAGELVAPLVPAYVYSSELLDRATCRPCSFVDGRRYADLLEAHRDYPGNGGYHLCEGGDRCRGTLVIVWQTEQTPTIDDTRGPEPGAPPVPPAPPPTPTRPPLAELDDATLMAELGTALDAGDEQAIGELGDELDRRDAAAGHTGPEPRSAAQVEADTWAENSAAAAEEYAADPDAYLRDLDEAHRLAEEAGGGVLDVVRTAAGQPRGRRIDRVRAEWDEEVERIHMDAERDTAGYLLRADRQAEFERAYGDNTLALFTGPARSAYYYASEELRAYWAARPRMTFSEYAVQRGVRDAKTLKRARTAAEVRDDAILRAGEDPARRAERRANRPRHVATEGDKLRRVQERAARERKKAADLARRLEQQAPGDVP